MEVFIDHMGYPHRIDNLKKSDKKNNERKLKKKPREWFRKIKSLIERKLKKK